MKGLWGNLPVARNQPLRTGVERVCHQVGQAFAVTLFEILSTRRAVGTDNYGDPSATTPGDVQVGKGGRFWLWTAVMQKGVATSAMYAFVDRVKAIGGDRAMYCALGNALNPQHIETSQLHKCAIKDDVELTF